VRFLYCDLYTRALVIFVLTAVHRCAKLDVSSFNPPRDIRGGAQNSKNGSRDPHITPFDLILYFLVSTHCRPYLCEIRNSSGDEMANMNFLSDDIVHALQNTIDSCINSATNRRGYVLERRFTKFSEITQCNGHYAVQGHSRSPILVPIESSYTTSYQWLRPTYHFRCRKYWSIFNHFYAIRPESYRIRWNYAAVRAITPFKVIQAHRVWYQSKAYMGLPISD